MKKRYKVAQGYSFTAGGVIYKGGDYIPESAFPDKSYLALMVSKGRIIEEGESVMTSVPNQVDEKDYDVEEKEVSAKSKKKRK